MSACQYGHLSVARLLLQHVGREAVQDMAKYRCTALHLAARWADEETVTFLLEQGAQASSRVEDGRKPLMLACGEGRLGVVKVLLHHVGEPALQETDNNGFTPLHWAAAWGHQETVSFLLGEGAQASSRDAYGNTPLVRACDKGRMGVVRLLVQHMGPQALQDTDDDGCTALHRAALWGHEEVVSFLIKEGAQTNSRGGGITPLLLACQEGKIGVVRVLLQHVGREALHETDNDGSTALHLAAYGGHIETATFLISEGAQANSRDVKGATPFLLACDKGQLGVVKVLLQHTGPQALQETDNQAFTALHLAAYGGHIETASFLISEGAQASSRDWYGATPLMRACRKGHMGVVRLLVQHQGPQALQETDNTGCTALHWAAEWGHAEVVKFLLVAGADPTVTDNQGRTPRAFADEDHDEGDVIERRRAGCVAAFEWYACELERRRFLHRATCLRKACTTQRDMPTSQVPTYLTARVAAGHALPHVEVVMPQSEIEQEQEGTTLVDADGKRKAADEGGDTQGFEAGEEERGAVLEFVLERLNEELLTDLLEGFPSNNKR